MAATVALSLIAAAHNEQDNVAQLVAEIDSVLAGAGIEYETIVVDDGSTDRTAEMIRELMATHPRLRMVRMRRTPPDRGNGQSAAFHAGIRASRGELIATMDADRQNDPADITSMIEKLHETGADLVQGDRSAERRDSALRRGSSVVGRLARRVLLGDRIRDTGCSLRVMRREVALQLPLELRGMHRFVPHTAAQLGFTVVEMPVHHRPRTAGEPKYGTGLGRAIPALFDSLAVRWMDRRRRDVTWDEPGSPEETDT